MRGRDRARARVRTPWSRATRGHAPPRRPPTSPALCARVRAVGRHDDEHLRRFLAARARGDAAAMRRWWDELVIDFYDRMDGFVAAAHRGRLDDDEHELAVAMSLTRSRSA